MRQPAAIGMTSSGTVIGAVFVIGALALMGIPVLNGFWSKELVLESGLTFGMEHGMLWAYAVMVLVAGLTALYTARCLWMVFYGPRRGEQQPVPEISAFGSGHGVFLIPKSRARFNSAFTFSSISRAACAGVVL